MISKSILLFGIGTVLIVIIMIALTLVFTPENTHPAYNAAMTFIRAAGDRDDDTAFSLLGNGLQTYVTENCPGGSVSACIDAYTPAEWGDLIAAEYRRSKPDGRAWDVLILANYEEGQGFTGVCIYHRMEEVAPDDWRVAAWSGFVSCDENNTGLDGLRRDDAPNRVP